MQKGIKLPLIGTITVAILGLMIGTSISVNVQQATASPSETILNNHANTACTPSGKCTFTGGTVINGPTTVPGVTHENCNDNSQRNTDFRQCNSH
jgi:hypothetical protein